MTYEKIFSNIDVDRQAKYVLEIEYEQNKGREASSGADDTSVLQEDGGQQGIVPFLQRVATIRCCKTGTLQVRREQANLQEMYHPLLSPSDERTNVQSDALGRSENDFVSPGCCHQAHHKRIVTSGNNNTDCNNGLFTSMNGDKLKWCV